MACGSNPDGKYRDSDGTVTLELKDGKASMNFAQIHMDGTYTVDGDKLTYQDLIHGALKGMLNSLDPHSEFMDAEKFDELKKDTEGEFGGLGVIVEVSKDKVLTVVSPMEDTPISFSISARSLGDLGR